MVLIILPCRGSITPPATCRTGPTIQTTGLRRGITIRVDCRSSRISFISLSRSATRSVIHMISRSCWIVNIATLSYAIRSHMRGSVSTGQRLCRTGRSQSCLSNWNISSMESSTSIMFRSIYRSVSLRKRLLRRVQLS